MRKIRILFLSILFGFMINSCIWTRPDEQIIPEPVQFSAVIIDRTTFENSVVTKPIQNIVKSGKIYIKDNIMFLNDVNKGFHVYDYTNPANPIKTGFINILGATDLAIRNNNLYINQATDLVTLSYNSTDNSIVILNRDKNVFPQKKSPQGFISPTTASQIIIDWIKI